MAPEDQLLLLGGPEQLWHFLLCILRTGLSIPHLDVHFRGISRTGFV